MYKCYSDDDIKKRKEELLSIDTTFSFHENSFYYTIEKQNKIIAYLIITKECENHLLKRIFVKKDERFKSYGTKLLNFVVRNKIKNGKIIAHEYEIIKTFLTKCGFKEVNKLFYFDSAEKLNRKIEGQKTAAFSIFWNFILAVTKIFFGHFGKSRGLLVDGFNSFSDILTSTGILLGIHFSNIPEDENHPFGHEKIESVIGIVMGIFMILTAFELGKNGLVLIFRNETQIKPQIITVYLAIFSSIVKYFMYKNKMKIGIKTQNSALIADAKDSKSDIFASLGVVVGIYLSIYVNPIFDLTISVVVSLLIFKEGITTIFDTTHILLDKQDLEFISEIENYIYENSRIKNVHDITARNSGDKVFLEFHIRLPEDMSIRDANKIADQLKLDIKEEFTFIKSVTIHFDCIL